MRLHAHTALFTAVLACGGIAATPVLAAEPAYVGLWSKRMEHCSTKQANPGAPMVVTAKGFDQHDLHCTFAKIEPMTVEAPGASGWQVAADCTWGKTPTKLEMTWAISGEALTLTDPGGTHVLQKCVAPPPAPK